MYVNEIRPNHAIDELELDIVEKEEPREIVTKVGRQSRVCDAWGVDSNGEKIRLSLWNGEIDRVTEGTKVKITNGWARTFHDQLQVSAGLHGKLDVVE